MNTPLNPDAVEAACRKLWESTENYPQQWEHVSPAVKNNLRKTVSKFASAYIAAALPDGDGRADTHECGCWADDGTDFFCTACTDF